MLDQLDGNPRVCVTGGAGTGKTLLAMEQARRLAARGLHVLIVCFNAPLGAHIRNQLEPVSGIEVFHFHLLCRTWAKRAGVDFERREGELDADYYDERLPELLLAAAGEMDDRYDAILVDEAQDFASNWLTALQWLLADEENGLMYLFADANQAIYRRHWAPSTGYLRFTLTDNPAQLPLCSPAAFKALRRALARAGT